MSRLYRFLSVFLSLMLLTNTLGCTKRVAVPEAQRPQVVATLPPLDDKLHEARVSPLDPRGARVVYLALDQPSGGARLFETVLMLIYILTVSNQEIELMCHKIRLPLIMEDYFLVRNKMFWVAHFMLRKAGLERWIIFVFIIVFCHRKKSNLFIMKPILI